MGNKYSAPIEILMVEDNPGDVRLAREAIRDAGLANPLHAVADGEAALAFLRQEGSYADAPRPDLILLDLNLPRKDGREVLRELKADPGLKGIPVAILSIVEDEKEIIETYSLHACCFIQKPLDLGQIVRVVQSIEGFRLAIVKLPPKE